MGTSRQLGSLLLALLAAGCYTYEPIEQPRPGMEVRARLSMAAAVRRSEQVDEPVRHVDGRVVAAAGDSVALDVLIGRYTSAFQNVTLRDTLTFGRADLESLSARRLSTARSIAFGAVVAGGAVGLVAALLGSESGGGDGDGQPPPPPRGAAVPAAAGSTTSPRILLRLSWPPW